MVDKNTSMARLNMEREYEDALVEKLSMYFMSSLPNIPMDESHKRLVHDNLLIIITDSRRHSDTFNELVQMVFESDEREY